MLSEGYEMDPLDLIRWKIWRAREHHEALRSLAERYFQSDFYTPRSYQDRKGRLVESVGDVKPMPEMMAFLIGDCAHNLRCALDHLAFLICRPRTERDEERVQFPITSSYRRFRGTKHMMPNAPRGYRTAVERLQPYHRRVNPDAVVLWQLKEINDWDKHRLLVTTAASLVDSEIEVRIIRGATSIVRVEKFRGGLKPGTILTRIQLGHSEAGAQVYVKPKLTLAPAFDHGMPKAIRGISAINCLARAGIFIEDIVLPALQRFA